GLLTEPLRPGERPPRIPGVVWSLLVTDGNHFAAAPPALSLPSSAYCRRSVVDIASVPLHIRKRRARAAGTPGRASASAAGTSRASPFPTPKIEAFSL